MTVETADDRAIMIADFGEQITFTPRIGPTASINGIFDNQYQAVDAGGSVDFAVLSPRLTVRTTDAPNVAEGDKFTIRDVIYSVNVVMADGTGITEISLEVQ